MKGSPGIVNLSWPAAMKLCIVMENRPIGFVPANEQDNWRQEEYADYIIVCADWIHK